jgi:hypothetical protein
MAALPAFALRGSGDGAGRAVEGVDGAASAAGAAASRRDPRFARPSHSDTVDVDAAAVLADARALAASAAARLQSLGLTGSHAAQAAAQCAKAEAAIAWAMTFQAQ